MRLVLSSLIVMAGFLSGQAAAAPEQASYADIRDSGFVYCVSGYLSEVTRKNTLKTTGLQYERFGRLQTEFKFKISAQKYDSVNKTLRIGGDFNKFYEMENIWPQPDSMYSKGNDLYLVYNDSEAMQNFTIWLRVTPVKPGSVKSFLQLNGEPEIRFRQFICSSRLTLLQSIPPG